VLDTSGGKSGRTRLGVPGDVVDLVGVTLLLEDAVTLAIIAVHLMLVVEISSSDHTLSID